MDERVKRGWEDLANAVIAQTASDYRKTLHGYKLYPKDYREQKRELELFFTSNWYNTLTSVDGKKLLSALRKEAGRR